MIDIFIDSRTITGRGSGITVVLRHDYHEWRRGMLIKKLTTNQLELKGTEYALKSITDKFKDEQIVIHSLNRYVVLMLERKDRKWTKQVEKNIDLIVEIRKQYERFTNISILFDPGHDRFRDIKRTTDEMILKKKEFFER